MTNELIIDSGAWSIQAGLPSQDIPLNILSPMATSTLGQDHSNSKEDTSHSPRACDLKCTDGEALMRWLYASLGLDATEHNVLWTEKVMSGAEYYHRTEIAEILFEVFGVPGLHFNGDATLQLYSTGRTTGLVFDFGCNSVTISPVMEGLLAPHGAASHPTGGKRLTTVFWEELNAANPHAAESLAKLSPTEQFLIANQLKEKHANVALDYDEELYWLARKDRKDKPAVHSLPDGTELTVETAAFKCSEALWFQPRKWEYRHGESTPNNTDAIPQVDNSLYKLPKSGIHSKLAVHNAMRAHYGGLEREGASLALHEEIYTLFSGKLDVMLMRDMLANVIATGGSCISGLAVRMSKEITNLWPSSMKIKVVCPPERSLSTWYGGCIVAEQQPWVTRMDYSECGADAFVAHSWFGW
eukprot:TRINITY_DN63206_c0_g1_i2.p1 TRINITY_DN63206_c0_g1~~TRINITY_DN63206_c0_g1_i2.p1  ORF type:complete len:414 (-),score=46.53 TRINITY_DN63206_c0_g1_i2:183-1424(-)